MSHYAFGGMLALTLFTAIAPEATAQTAGEPDFFYAPPTAKPSRPATKQPYGRDPTSDYLFCSAYYGGLAVYADRAGDKRAASDHLRYSNEFSALGAVLANFAKPDHISQSLPLLLAAIDLRRRMGLAMAAPADKDRYDGIFRDYCATYHEAVGVAAIPVISSKPDGEPPRDNTIDYLLCSAYHSAVGAFERREQAYDVALLAYTLADRFSTFALINDSATDPKSAPTLIWIVAELKKRSSQAVVTADLKKTYTAMYWPLCSRLEGTLEDDPAVKITPPG